MQSAITTLSRPRRPVSVAVRPAPARRSRETLPDLVMLAVLPGDASRVGDTLPSCVVRDTSGDGQDAFVEHLRLRGREGLAALPGLSNREPTRLRDAVRIAMGAGASAVDVVLVKVPGLRPWDLAADDVVHSVTPILSTMVGAVIVFPDLTGPPDVGHVVDEGDEARVERVRQVVKAYGTHLTEAYQVAFLDCPPLSGDRVRDLLYAAANSDCALFRWRGSVRSMARHGWRSAAALAGGVVASSAGNVLAPVSGVTVPLEGGRSVSTGRREALAVGPAGQDIHREEDDYIIDVEARGDDTAAILSDSLMRAPMGLWTIPATRMAKVIHYRVMQTASRFVFEQADLPRAVALSTAIQNALAPFADAGLLAGPEGQGRPVVKGSVVRDRSAPGLRLDLAAQLRPWAHSVSVQVSLRPGGVPQVVERA